jgi:hypothetical protein
MCTIMTFDYVTFCANKTAIVSQIRADAVGNPDGWSLVLTCLKGSVSLNTMDVSVIVALLDTVPFARFWLHSRAATGRDTGVAYSHNFRTNSGLLIQHNGIIDNPDNLPVDSMRIGHLVDSLGLDFAIDYLSNTEHFFNTFFIEPEYGSYTVVRLGGGSLHTDNQGNYSTKAISGICSNSVSVGYWESYPECVAKPVVLSQANSSIYQGYGDWLGDSKAVSGTNKVAKGLSDWSSWGCDVFFQNLDSGHYLAYPDSFDDAYIDAGEPNLTLADLDMVPGCCLDNVFCTEPVAAQNSKKHRKGV